jgi:carbonic anhydrase
MAGMNKIRNIPIILSVSAVVYAQHASSTLGPTADAVWKQLLEGNERYVTGRLKHPNQGPTRRDEVARGQRPFAAILSCADSRVPPEVVFDRGLGDLFTVRVAGNVATDEVIASLEFAVAHLGPKLIVVLGHERCGAVDATLKGSPPEGHLAVLLDRIKPAVTAAKDQAGDALNNTIQANIRNVVNQLRTTAPILAEKVKNGEVAIIGAEYDLDTGRIQVVQ